MTEYIHPKTEVVREVAESNHNKIQILKRAGFVPLEGYKAPKPPKVVADPSLAEVVEKEKVDAAELADAPAPEVAIHITPTARRIIEKHELDPALIRGSGKDGAIVKKDVQNYMKVVAEAEKEADAVTAVVEEEPVGFVKATEEEEEAEKVLSAEDILTHDDDPDLGTDSEPEMEGDGSEEIDPVVEDESEEEEVELAEEMQKAGMLEDLEAEEEAESEDE